LIVASGDGRAASIGGRPGEGIALFSPDALVQVGDSALVRRSTPILTLLRSVPTPAGSHRRL